MPPPLVTTLPHVAPLSFGWLSHFPAPQPLPLVAPPPGASAFAIHYASTFCRAPLVWLVVALPSASTPILLQLRLVPWPPPLVDPLLLTAFGVVCRRSCRRIPPLRRNLPQSRRPPTTLPFLLSSRRASVASAGPPFAVVVAAGTLARVRRQRGVSSPIALAAHTHCQGMAPRREQVQVNDVCVQGTPLELGQKASCVSQL